MYAVQAAARRFDAVKAKAPPKKIKFASGGVRTREAYAEDLKSSPFDHSGTLVSLPKKNVLCNLRSKSKDHILSMAS